jgi:hypothetical protein
MNADGSNKHIVTDSPWGGLDAAPHPIEVLVIIKERPLV